MMEVFMVPVGHDRHELYCESPLDHLDSPAAGESSWFRRRVDRFRKLVADAEEERRRRERGEAVESGIWHWIMRKVAETINEQRLLWLLRREWRATLVHPDDVMPARAVEIAREILRSDYERHRRWVVIDSLLVLLCLPLTVLPGPNVPSLYFTFRAVGHYLSMRGATRGRTGVDWALVSSTELTSLRQALGLARDARRLRVGEISAALGLDRLDAFVERVA